MTIILMWNGINIEKETFTSFDNLLNSLSIFDLIFTLEIDMINYNW